MSFVQDTIAALATPVGTSALAVLRVSGARVPELAEQIFGKTPPPRRARHGDYRDLQAQLVDDVVFTYFAAPNSFTGEDSLEISCHGNPFIAQRMLEDLFARGCRPAEAGEFSKRAFLNGKLDLSQAEAVMDLIHARSARALEVANQQLRGAVGKKMEELISLLVEILAHLEAYIDFPDEDLPTEDRQLVLRKLDQLLLATHQLIATNHYGELLREGIKTVIIGEPNAGKSSLLNRLAGRERALVSAEPGTTRDYIEERISLGDHWLRLIDTAGLNRRPSVIEQKGIDKTVEQAASADLFLWVIDGSATGGSTLVPVGRMDATNTLLVYNKCDLPASAMSFPSPAAFVGVSVSALTGAGFETLRESINRMAESRRVVLGDDVIAINARHAHALKEAFNCLESARSKLANSDFSELVASDLRGTMEFFGQISGRVDNEKILDQLFASFCIGK